MRSVCVPPDVSIVTESDVEFDISALGTTAVEGTVIRDSDAAPPSRPRRVASRKAASSIASTPSRVARVPVAARRTVVSMIGAPVIPLDATKSTNSCSSRLCSTGRIRCVVAPCTKSAEFSNAAFALVLAASTPTNTATPSAIPAALNASWSRWREWNLQAASSSISEFRAIARHGRRQAEAFCRI